MDTLLQRLHKIHKEIKGFSKDSQGYGFKYVGSNVILSNIRALMQDYGVLLVPRAKTATLMILKQEDGGMKNMPFTTEMWFTFTWYNVDDKEDFMECEWYGQGIDNGEKGVGKAATYAEKYFLLKFFQIPTDADDPDGHEGYGTATGATNKHTTAPKGGTRREPPPVKNENEIDWQKPNIDKIIALIETFTDIDALNKWVKLVAADVKKLRAGWQTQIADATKAQRERIEKGV